MSGAAAVGSSGDLWNQVTQENITNQALTDVSGNAVGAGVTLSVADPNGGIGVYGGLINSPASIAPLFTTILYNTTNDPAQPTVLTFNNVPAGTYDLYLYQGTDGNGESRVSTGVANGVSGTVGPENGQADVSQFGTPYNYIELPGVVVGRRRKSGAELRLGKRHGVGPGWVAAYQRLRSACPSLRLWRYWPWAASEVAR